VGESGAAGLWRKWERVLALAFATVSGVWGSAVHGQSNEWAWMGGDTTCEAACAQLGVYGVFQTPAKGNIPSGRTGPVSWKDKSGNLWLFGGYGSSVANYLVDNLDDLWEFNPTVREWAWMGGTYPYMGQPGVYGVLGTPAATNMPGSRSYATAWTDASGNFWLFGGQGYDLALNYDFLNDLWKFDLSTGEWTWISGSTTASNGVGGVAGGQPGIYGTLQTPSASNVPGGRWGASSWVDGKGNLWLFGGFGFDSKGRSGELNDLWEFNASTHIWMWMSGSSTVPASSPFDKLNSSQCAPYAPFACGQPGVYGTIRTPAAGNTPGGRDSAVSWIDQSGNLWLFAGEGFDSNDASGSLNDLWDFNPATNQWTWIGGSTTANSIPVYGTPQTPGVGNIPWGGSGLTAWTDLNHKVWVFGGTNLGIGDESGSNDLWVFDPTTVEWAWMSGSKSDSGGQPVYGTLGSPALGNIPGGRYSAANWVDPSGNLWLMGGAGYVGSIWTDINDLWEYVVPAAPAPVPSYGEYASPISITVPQGSSGSLTITSVVGYGFSSPVSLSASGQPAGVNVSFNPSSITGSGSSQMTVAVDSSTTPGSYTIAVNGASGSAQQSAAVTLIVPVPFSLAVSPTPITLGAGGRGMVTITARAQDSFDSPITLSASNLWNGVSISFSPATITGAGSSEATISIDASVNPGGEDDILISGTSGSVTQTAGLALKLSLAPANFTVGASPSALSVVAGSQVTDTLTVTPQNGFSSAVSFACSGLPAGATCAFNPTTVTPSGSAATATLTVTAPAQSAMVRPEGGPWLPVTSLAFVAGLFGWRRRRSALKWLAMVVVLASMGLISACGAGSSGGGGGGSTPITSTVTVTATSGSLQQTATFMLTVN
jgi:hypothetical protein